MDTPTTTTTTTTSPSFISEHENVTLTSSPTASLLTPSTTLSVLDAFHNEDVESSHSISTTATNGNNNNSSMVSGDTITSIEPSHSPLIHGDHMEEDILNSHQDENHDLVTSVHEDGGDEQHFVEPFLDESHIVSSPGTPHYTSIHGESIPGTAGNASGGGNEQQQQQQQQQQQHQQQMHSLVMLPTETTTNKNIISHHSPISASHSQQHHNHHFNNHHQINEQQHQHQQQQSPLVGSLQHRSILNSIAATTPTSVSGNINRPSVTATTPPGNSNANYIPTNYNLVYPPNFGTYHPHHYQHRGPHQHPHRINTSFSTFSGASPMNSPMSSPMSSPPSTPTSMHSPQILSTNTSNNGGGSGVRRDSHSGIIGSSSGGIPLITSTTIPASMVAADFQEVDDQYSDMGEIREQDRYLPIAIISRIMKKSLPPNAKIAKEAKETIQECVSEFISFITSEASDRCVQEKRKTITGDDLLLAMQALGFDDYIEPLRTYLIKYRDQSKGDKGSKKKKDSTSHKGGNSSNRSKNTRDDDHDSQDTRDNNTPITQPTSTFFS